MDGSFSSFSYFSYREMNVWVKIRSIYYGLSQWWSYIYLPLHLEQKSCAVRFFGILTVRCMKLELRWATWIDMQIPLCIYIPPSSTITNHDRLYSQFYRAYFLFLNPVFTLNPSTENPTENQMGVDPKTALLLIIHPIKFDRANCT